MNFILLYAFFRLISLLYCQNPFKVQIVENRWQINSTDNCTDGLKLANRTMLKIAIDKTNTSKALMNIFVKSNESEIPKEVLGDCEILNTSTKNAYIYANLSCNSSSELFKNVEGIVNVEWDLYQNTWMTMNFTQRQKTANDSILLNCSLTGENDTTYVEYGSWNVTSCFCYPCCFVEGKNITIRKLNEQYNEQVVMIEGQVTGPYCEHILSNKDVCYLNNTEKIWDYEPPKNDTFFWCDHMPKRAKANIIFERTGWTMTWDGDNCTLVARTPTYWIFLAKLEFISWFIFVYLLLILFH